MDPWIGIAGIAIGTLMIGQWTVALVTRRVPELESRPIEIRLHLVAEFLTALVLIVGGIGTLAGALVGPPVLLFGLGMLTYTAIVSPGWFLARGQRAPVAMFAVLVVIALVGAASLTASLSR